jgi:ribosomal protein S19E (S16A)
MASKLLWKLEALGWVEPVDDGFAITDTGVEALTGTGAST